MSILKGKLKLKYNNEYQVIHPETEASQIVDFEEAVINTLPANNNYVNSTEYKVGDIAKSKYLPSWAYLECLVAGTSSESTPKEFDESVTVGQKITDNNITWIVRKTGVPNSDVLNAIAETDIDENQMYYGTGKNAVATTAISPIARTLIEKADTEGFCEVLQAAKKDHSHTAESLGAADKVHTHDYGDLTYMEIAAAHNGLYRGKDLTSYFESGEMTKAIDAGNFKDIYPGDYIVKSITIDDKEYKDVKWIIGDIDYYYGKGWNNPTKSYSYNTGGVPESDYEATGSTIKHHVLVFPETVIGASYMNSTDIVTGGYTGSYMWKTVIPKYVTAIKGVFGDEHIVHHWELLTNSVNANGNSCAGAGWTGCTNSWTWTEVDVNIFNEPMVYGSTHFSSSGYDIGESNSQVAAFTHNKPLINTRQWSYWLRAVSGSPGFALVDFAGNANRSYASSVIGLRPYFLLR